jgi:hypothetical protein
MKLERINAAAQTELPNAMPLSRSQSVSNMSAPMPDKNRILEKIATRAVARKFCERAGEPCVVGDLFIVARMPCSFKDDGASNSSKK